MHILIDFKRENFERGFSSCSQESCRDYSLNTQDVIKIYKEINEEIKKCRNELEGDKLWYALTISFDSDGNFKEEYDYNSHEEDAVAFI